MHHQFIGEVEKITAHYGIRPAIFEGVMPVYTVVMLNDPQRSVLSLASRPAAVQYCRDLERTQFSYDGVTE